MQVRYQIRKLDWILFYKLILRHYDRGIHLFKIEWNLIKGSFVIYITL